MTNNEIGFCIFYGLICIAGLITALTYWYNELYKKRNKSKPFCVSSKTTLTCCRLKYKIITKFKTMKTDNPELLNQAELGNKFKTDVSVSTKQVKLGEIFECEGVLYSIVISTTMTGDSNLEDNRNIFKFIK